MATTSHTTSVASTPGRRVGWRHHGVGTVGRCRRTGKPANDEGVEPTGQLHGRPVGVGRCRGPSRRSSSCRFAGCCGCGGGGTSDHEYLVPMEATPAAGGQGAAPVAGPAERPEEATAAAEHWGRRSRWSRRRGGGGPALGLSCDVSRTAPDDGQPTMKSHLRFGGRHWLARIPWAASVAVCLQGLAGRLGSRSVDPFEDGAPGRGRKASQWARRGRRGRRRGRHGVGWLDKRLDVVQRRPRAVGSGSLDRGDAGGGQPFAGLTQRGTTTRRSSWRARDTAAVVPPGVRWAWTGPTVQG